MINTDVQQKNKKYAKQNEADKATFQTKLSIIKLFAAENISSLLAIFASMLVVELAVFWLIGLKTKPEFIEAAVYVVRIPIYAVMAVSFVLTCYILSNTLTGKAGKPVYTIQRLRATEKDIYVLNSIYNALMFLVYLGFQALTILLMITLFNASGCGNGGLQNIMMAMYRTPFFHSVIPMENWLLVVRNVIFVLALGSLTALKSQRSREGKTVYGLYICAAVILISFIFDPMQVGGMTIIRGIDMVARFFVVPFGWAAFESGKNHRQTQWENDEFESSLAEYRNNDENE